MIPRAAVLVLRLLAPAAVAAGCAAAALDVHHPVPVAPPAVTIAVRDATRGSMSRAEVVAFREIVVQELARSGIRVVGSEEPGAARVLGTVTRYDDGNRLVRYLTSFGPGTGIVVSRWGVADRRSREVARCTIEGTISMGAFGGSFDDVLEETGQALARFLKGRID
jgi:hypothetical protein